MIYFWRRLSNKDSRPFVLQGKKYANKVVKNVYCCILTPFDIMTVQNESILSCNETDKLCKNCL